MTTGNEIPEGGRISFSSHGEDVIAHTLLERWGLLPSQGFYVDVGAFHPTVFSNTALFHRLGWTGINVEPNPAMAQRLRAARPNDTTLECAVGSSRRFADLLFFYEWASSNTLSPEFAEKISTGQGVSVSDRIKVEVVPLSDIFREHLPANRHIDLMTIDVEGMDMEVLQSNDWNRYRPSLVMVEDGDFNMHQPTASTIYQFMIDIGYRPVAHAVLTSIYLKL